MVTRTCAWGYITLESNWPLFLKGKHPPKARPKFQSKQGSVLGLYIYNFVYIHIDIYLERERDRFPCSKIYHWFFLKSTCCEPISFWFLTNMKNISVEIECKKKTVDISLEAFFSLNQHIQRKFEQWNKPGCLEDYTTHLCGIIANNYKDPYETTSTTESKFFFCDSIVWGSVYPMDSN